MDRDLVPDNSRSTIGGADGRSPAILSVLCRWSFYCWWWGLTFYAAIVIPLGTQVLGGEAQGFVTQQVSQRINLLAAIAFSLLLVKLIWRRDSVSRGVWWLWSTLTGCQCVLFLYHPRLSAMLDYETRTVVDGEVFYGAHRIYLVATTVQWLVGFLWLVWSEFDQTQENRHLGI